MIPAEIKSADLRPVLWNRKRRDADVILVDGEHAATAELWYPADTRIALVLRITRDQYGALLRREMPRVFDAGLDDDSAQGLLRFSVYFVQ